MNQKPLRLLKNRKRGASLMNSDGLFHIPLILATSVIVLGGFGILGLMRHWRFLVETQLRLNECVGKIALEFRDHLNSIHQSNQRIQKIRVAIVAAHLEPSLIPPLKLALEAQVIQQEAVRMNWKFKSLKWIKENGCEVRGDIAFPLPVLKYERPPPDSIGSHALQWLPEVPSSFIIQAGHRPRWAAAMVKGRSDVPIQSHELPSSTYFDESATTNSAPTIFEEPDSTSFAEPNLIGFNKPWIAIWAAPEKSIWPSID